MFRAKRILVSILRYCGSLLGVRLRLTSQLSICEVLYIPYWTRTPPVLVTGSFRIRSSSRCHFLKMKFKLEGYRSMPPKMRFFIMGARGLKFSR